MGSAGPFNEEPFHKSPSSVGLTRTISTRHFQSWDHEQRKQQLRAALCAHNPAVDHADHNARAANIAISYEYARVRPGSHEGLAQLDAMLCHIFSSWNVSAFRLWVDKIYTRDQNAPHMRAQTWIDHGLTPYAFFPVLVLGGRDTLNSIRGWVRCELASAQLHKGFFYVHRGQVERKEGMSIGWNNHVGKEKAKEIYDGLYNNQLELREEDEKKRIMQLMRQFAGMM